MLTLVLTLLVGCSSDDQGDSNAQAQMCKTANNYIWRVNQFGSSPPSPGNAEETLARLIDLSISLTNQVPESKRGHARTATKTWRAGDRVFARYDYGQGGDMPQQFLDDLHSSIEKYRESNQHYVNWLTDECAPADDQWPTPPPEQ